MQLLMLGLRRSGPRLDDLNATSSLILALQGKADTSERSLKGDSIWLSGDMEQRVAYSWQRKHPARHGHQLLALMAIKLSMQPSAGHMQQVRIAQRHSILQLGKDL